MRKTAQNIFLMVTGFLLVFGLTAKMAIAQEKVFALDLTEKVMESKVDYRIGNWNGFNSFQYIVKGALDSGVSENTIVLLMLLPVVATLVSVMHYVLGLTGYGIFMPSMIAVTFLATGIFGGLLLFAIILLISIISNMILRKMKIHFWPARAMNLMFISLGAFGLMILTAKVSLINLSNISIFPVLFMIMLAEEFVRTQLVKSKSEAKKLTIGTLVLSVVGAIIMSIKEIQSFVLFHPGTMILIVIIVNLWVGNYTGIRLSEIARFRKAIRSKSKKTNF